MATLKEIAKAAGVSAAVVSRLMNGDTTLRISAATRERVLRTVDRLDYTPNAAAQSLRSARSRLIALVVHDVSNPIYSEIIAAAQTAAARYGHALLVGEAATVAERDNRLINLIKAGAIDGLILQGAGAATDIALEQAARHSVRTVLLQVEAGGDCGLLRLPDEAAAAVATRHLLALGHRRIACLAPAAKLGFAKRRVAGWKSALAEAGIGAKKRWLTWSGSSLEAGYDGARRLLAASPKVTGLVVCNAVAAVGALRAITEAGRTVPHDLSVIALHDVPLLAFLNPALTAVRMPLAELGADAVDLLCSDRPLRGLDLEVGDAEPSVTERESAAPLRGR